LGADAYGARICRELVDHAGRSVSEPTGRRGGKAKRYFALRPEGEEALRSTRDVRERMWAGVPDGGGAHAG
jgi:hypothetical protein